MEMSNSQTFWELIKNAAPEATVTNFIIVAEIRDSDSPRLQVMTSDLMTPWTAEGMLKWAMDMLPHINDVDDEEE